MARTSKEKRFSTTKEEIALDAAKLCLEKSVVSGLQGTLDLEENVTSTQSGRRAVSPEELRKAKRWKDILQRVCGCGVSVYKANRLQRTQCSGGGRGGTSRKKNELKGHIK